MKEYKVRTELLNFFSNWKNNIRWKISNLNIYSIRCDNREQLDFCIATLKEVNPTARTHPDGGFPHPAYVRWFDSDTIGDIIVTRQERSAGRSAAFMDAFEEADELTTGYISDVPEHIVSVISKRLDGHVITL